MKYDVLVIAGTTESRQVIEELVKEEKRVLASVATELGARMLADYPVDLHVGRLDREGFLTLFSGHEIAEIIDASHPFARIVTDTVRSAAEEAGIPYRRYERKMLSYDYDRIIYVPDAEAAVKRLNGMTGNVLLTTGVNTAALYAEGVKNAKDRVYIRVLDNEASREGCRKAGYPEDHVIAEMPPFSVEDNLSQISATGAKVMVSKDSGKAGGVDIKVEACKKAGIDMILISRPEG